MSESAVLSHASSDGADITSLPKATWSLVEATTEMATMQP